MKLDGMVGHDKKLKARDLCFEVVLQPDPYPAITFRTIGGVLDFYIFLGPTPENAVQQYTEAVGRPLMPPYWTLGFHLCRWGYLNQSDMQMVIKRNRAAGIPYDVQWGDIEYMYEKFVFSYDRRTYPNLTDIVKDLHEHNQKFIVIADPGIGNNENIMESIKTNSPGYDIYEDGVKSNVFVKNATDEVLIAKVWPGTTAYPDFTNSMTQPWWEKWMRYFYYNESIHISALWIDMNEPSSFVPGSVDGCTDNKWDYPPYVPNILGRDPGNKMFDKTICMNSKQSWGKGYDVHSLYGHSMAIQTYQSLKNLFPGKRPWAMTRSSFSGTQKYATKWMGDNQSRWIQMYWSIIGILDFSLFGFAMNGADICGFWYEAEYEMCLRWHQLGAFYPFSRNHNARGDEKIFKDQDPAAWDQRFIDITKQALLTRYKLLPYLYTLQHNAHVHGTTSMRPLMFDFSKDKKTWSIDRQFLLGSALLLSPALEKGQTWVNAYFPNTIWYDYFTGEEIPAKGAYYNLSTPLEKFNLHVRGGFIIPWQEPSTTTKKSRQKPMGLLVALNETFTASGELFWDDGEGLDTYETNQYLHVKFDMKKEGELLISIDQNNYTEAASLKFESIDICGLRSIPQIITLDNSRLDDFKIRQNQQIVELRGLDLNITEPHNITWSLF